MRVCYVASQALSTDGWGRYTVEVVLGARQRGIEPVLVTANPEVDPALAAVPHHVILPKLMQQRFTTPRSLLLAPQLRRILQTCDVVHCITELYAPLVAASRPRRTRFVLTLHGTWAVRPLESQTTRAIFARAFRSADAVTAASHYTRDRVKALVNLPDVIVISGGVHPQHFAKPAQANLPDWVGREPVVFSAGGLKKRKGHHITLEAVALARQHIPNLHFAMTGNADPEGFAGELQHRATELGIADTVHFLGMLPPYGALVAWFQQADVFAMPSVNQGSSFEGLGMVFLEAAAAGTPSIGTLDCGASDAIIHGESGLLVPQDDPQATAEAIIAIVGDPERRARMGQAAHDLAHRLSWDNLVERFIELYVPT